MVLVHGQGDREVGALVFNRRVDDDGTAREMVFFGVAQRQAHPITGAGHFHIVVHDLERLGVPGSVGGQEKDLVVDAVAPGLDVADGHQSDALDVEVLVHG